MKIKLPLYRFRKNDLEYDQLYLTPKNILKFLLIQLGIAITLISFLSLFSNTPKERRLKREISELKYEFEIVNRKTDDVLYLLELLEKKDSIIYQSLFADISLESKFEGGYIPLYDGEYADTLVYIGDKLSKIELKLERANYHFRKLILEITHNNERLSHTPAIQPMSNDDLQRTSSGFGMRMHPIYKVRKFHYGMDFVAPVGTPIYATADGVVEIRSNSFYGYGKYVRIDHGFDYKTAYGHMHEIVVNKGQRVKRGDIIGYVGNTGLSTGPHLHYEVIADGRRVDPINFYFHDLTVDQYEEMIRISNSIQKSLD